MLYFAENRDSLDIDKLEDGQIVMIKDDSIWCERYFIWEYMTQEARDYYMHNTSLWPKIIYKSEFSETAAKESAGLLEKQAMLYKAKEVAYNYFG